MQKNNLVQRGSLVLSYMKNNFFLKISCYMFLIFTVISLAVAFQHFYLITENTRFNFSLGWHIPFNFVYWQFWTLFFVLVYLAKKKYDLNRMKTFYWITFYFIIPSITILLHQLMASIIISNVFGQEDINSLLYTRTLKNDWVWIDLGVYITMIVGFDVLEFHNKSKLTELKYNQLESQLAQSQLNALKSQLHPHFLFNTLNTLSTLILKADNKEADRMLSLLRSFLKTTIFENDRHVIPLEDEMRFINNYLEIEKVRFKDKLEIKEELEPSTFKASVPNFLLQPIVENAIHHGIAPKTANGLIKISSKRENDLLLISIEDNGPGIQNTISLKKKEGVGLKITRKRMQYLFGHKQILELVNSPLGGLKVNLLIPFTELN